MMPPTVDWYYDFVSPFSYLQLETMPARLLGAGFNPRPVLLAGLLEHWGQKGPAEIAEKRRFTYRFVQWRAERAGVPLRFPASHPFNPIRALRLAIVAGGELEAVRTIFRHIWRDGRSVEDATDLCELGARLGVGDPVAAIAEPRVKAALIANGRRAIEAGVFGVPSLVMDGELFWGEDSTAMALDYLGDPRRFAAGEFGRLRDLPIGAQRSSR